MPQRRAQLLTVLIALALAIAGLFLQTDTAKGEGESSFVLPIVAPGEPVTVTQGNNMPKGPPMNYDHNPGTTGAYAFDFAVKKENFVIGAATSGTIIDLNDSSDQQCDDFSCWTHANFVLVADDDGKTATLYMHLLKGSTCSNEFCVHKGNHVKQGNSLGKAGTTGWSSGVHLHFQVENLPTWQSDPYSGWWFTQSVSVPQGFSNPEVLAQRSDGIPKTGDSFIARIENPNPR